MLLSQVKAPGLLVILIIGDEMPVPKPENTSLRADVESFALA
jgi:hypothetical protein